jgi:hypothetical protein
MLGGNAFEQSNVLEDFFRPLLRGVCGRILGRLMLRGRWAHCRFDSDGEFSGFRGLPLFLIQVNQRADRRQIQRIKRDGALQMGDRPPRVSFLNVRRSSARFRHRRPEPPRVKAKICAVRVRCERRTMRRALSRGEEAFHSLPSGAGCEARFDVERDLT